MADKCVVLVDNSNIFIEGQKHASRLKGIGADPITGKQPGDPSWRIDFAGLLIALAGTRKIYKAILVGSRPPQNDGLWDAATANGFEVKVHNRGLDNKEKAVDTELVAMGTEVICLSEEVMDCSPSALGGRDGRIHICIQSVR